MSGGMGMEMDMGNTSPECYATDDAFLETLAYCISTHCQNVAIWHLEKYWIMNVAGTQLDQPAPKATYQQTLAKITSRPTNTLVIGEELNQTMIISTGDYEASYNAHGLFEETERNHETYGIILLVTWHVLLSIFVLAGCYWHILARFQRQWGYENWIYTAIAIWGFERAMRLARLARDGVKAAQVTIIDEDYIYVNIEGVSGSGHAYLYFPTLTWRVWENHPFSVASAVLPRSAQVKTVKHEVDLEKRCISSDSSESDNPEKRNQSPARIGLTFLLRTKTGVTGQLREHATLPVLVESAYGPHEDLSEYSLLVCIAGGVGITACVPYLRAHPGATKLHWGVRSQGIVDAMAPSLGGVEQEIYVGKRMSIREVLYKELGDGGSTAVVLVSGPSGMADEVRCVISELGRQKKGVKVKLVEEAFSW
ncbi:MAG: hypothetical protein Q9225_004073 [Loekoesia sp. 1 TL-2023]